MFRLSSRSRIVPREQSTQTCRRSKLQTEMRKAFCNQAHLEIVEPVHAWDHHQRRQRALPRLRHDLSNQGAITSSQASAADGATSRTGRDCFIGYLAPRRLRLSPTRRVNPSRSSRSRNGTMIRLELPSACRSSLTVAGPFLEMKSPTALFMRSKFSRNSTTSGEISVTFPVSIKNLSARCFFGFALKFSTWRRIERFPG